MKKKTPNVLFITSFWPYPDKDGGRVVAAQILETLNTYCNLTIISNLQDNIMTGKKLALDKYPKADNILIKGKRAGAKKIPFYWLKGKSYFLFRDYSKDYLNEVFKTLEKKEIDYIVLDRGMPIIYIPEIKEYLESHDLRAKMIFFSHNVESLIVRDFVTKEPNLLKKIFKLPYYIDYLLTEKFEINALKQLDLITCISQVDADFFKNKGIDNVELYPQAFMPGVTEEGKTYPHKLQKDSFKIKVLSRFAWYPNFEGIAWFINNAWPKVKKAVPKAELHLAGRETTEALEKMVAEDDAIYSHGFVWSEDEFIKDSALTVSPIFSGSGTKIKILRTLQQGIPAVASPFSLKGMHPDVLDAIPATDDPDKFAELVIDLLKNYDSRLKQQEKLTKAFFKHYEVSVLQNYIKRIIK